MNTREQLQALNDELRRLKAEGRRTVNVTEETLAELRAALADESAEEFAGGSTVLGSPPQPAAQVEAPRERFTVSEAAGPGPASVRPAAPPKSAPAPRADVALPDGDKRTRWNALREIVLNDPTCKANVHPGKQVVFGVGNLDAAIMFVGEAPGGDEEDQGEPFVGRAGQLLNRMIKAMGLERDQVYIGNILNWRPAMGARNPDGSQTGNRPPTQEEMACCLPFIRAQIAVVQPRVLVALGKTAVDGLLGPERSRTLRRLRR